jgi:hypothetical protein
MAYGSSRRIGFGHWLITGFLICTAHNAQNLKPSYLDAQAELEHLVEASAIDATRRFSYDCRKKKWLRHWGKLKKTQC